MKRIPYVFNVLIMLSIMFYVGFLAPFGSITPVGMKVLGVFLGLIYGWMFVGLLWPSFAGLIVLGMSGYTTVAGAFSAGFGNITFLQIFFFFIIAAYAEFSGLSDKIALWFLSRKSVAGRPWFFVAMLFAASYVLGVFIMTYAVIFFMWAILAGICNAAGYRRADRSSAYLFVGVLQMATLGGTIMPYQVFPRVCMNALMQTTGLSVPSGTFIIFMTIVSVTAMLLYILAGRLLRVDVSGLGALKPELVLAGKSFGFAAEQKIAAAILLGFTLAILLPLILPQDSLYVKLYGQVGDFGLLVVAVCLACGLKVGGKSLADFTKLAGSGLNWDLLALVSATLVVGPAIVSEDTGIISWAVSIIMPVFSNMSGVMFVVSSFVLLSILAQFVHNLILAATFIPILSNLAISLNMGEQTAVIIAAGLSQILLAALLTPAASNRGALIYGYEWIGRKQGFAFALCAVMTTDMTVIAMGIPLAFLIL